MRGGGGTDCRYWCVSRRWRATLLVACQSSIWDRYWHAISQGVPALACECGYRCFPRRRPVDVPRTKTVPVRSELIIVDDDAINSDISLPACQSFDFIRGEAARIGRLRVPQNDLKSGLFGREQRMKRLANGFVMDVKGWFARHVYDLKHCVCDELRRALPDVLYSCSYD